MRKSQKMINEMVNPEKLDNNESGQKRIEKKLDSVIDVNSIPDFESVKQRFEDSFQAFVRDKKYTAAAEAIREEFGKESLVRNEDFVNQVADRIEDEALVEKRFVFISVNQEYLESISKQN